MRLVLDTDVLVAGLRSSSGASRVLLQAVQAGVIMPLVSVATVLEYEAVLTRREQRAAFGLGVGDVEAFLDGLVARAEHVEPHFSYRACIKDPDDEMFVAVAVNGGADAIVTFNIGDYAPANSNDTALGVTICRPGDILRRLPWRPSAISPFASPLH